MKIALIQPGSWGDNINSTLMFKPIHDHWPDAKIDVYTSTIFGSAFHNNPHISNLIETPANSKQEALHQLVTTPPLLKNRGYNIILNPHPMINPDKWTSTKNDYGTNLICAWIRALEDNNIPYDPKLETILKLNDLEVEKAERLYRTIDKSRPLTIMEITGESGQTFFNEVWLDQILNTLCTRNQNVAISNRTTNQLIEKYKKKYPHQVYFIGSLSLRECVVIFNKSSRFISVSSGLSNACNTNYAKKDIQWIEIINSPAVSSAPIRAEGKQFWYENNVQKFVQHLSTLC